MRVKVLYFQSVGRVTGKSAEEVDLPGNGATIGVLLRALEGRHPGLQEIAGGLMFAVNAEHAGPEAPLAEGDEVALMPPFSGG